MVGRFQVMALLQAARAKALGCPLDEVVNDLKDRTRILG